LSDSDPQGPARTSSTPAAQVDLTAGVASGALVISAESREDPADRDHRHAQESADARVRRWKEAIRFGLAALLLVGVGVVSARFVLDPGAAPDEKAWGRNLLFGLATALVGYFLGKKEKE
jgi:hypothetical protein